MLYVLMNFNLYFTEMSLCRLNSIELLVHHTFLYTYIIEVPTYFNFENLNNTPIVFKLNN